MSEEHAWGIVNEYADQVSRMQSDIDAKDREIEHLTAALSLARSEERKRTIERCAALAGSSQSTEAKAIASAIRSLPISECGHKSLGSYDA